jgi:hypothetical protein
VSINPPAIPSPLRERARVRVFPLILTFSPEGRRKDM